MGHPDGCHGGRRRPAHENLVCVVERGLLSSEAGFPGRGAAGRRASRASGQPVCLAVPCSLRMVRLYGLGMYAGMNARARARSLACARSHTGSFATGVPGLPGPAGARPPDPRPASHLRRPMRGTPAHPPGPVRPVRAARGSVEYRPPPLNVRFGLSLKGPERCPASREQFKQVLRRNRILRASISVPLMSLPIL